MAWPEVPHCLIPFPPFQSSDQSHQNLQYDFLLLGVVITHHPHHLTETHSRNLWSLREGPDSLAHIVITKGQV